MLISFKEIEFLKSIRCEKNKNDIDEIIAYFERVRGSGYNTYDMVYIGEYYENKLRNVLKDVNLEEIPAGLFIELRYEEKNQNVVVDRDFSKFSDYRDIMKNFMFLFSYVRQIENSNDLSMAKNFVNVLLGVYDKNYKFKEPWKCDYWKDFRKKFLNNKSCVKCGSIEDLILQHSPTRYFVIPFDRFYSSLKHMSWVKFRILRKKYGYPSEFSVLGFYLDYLRCFLKFLLRYYKLYDVVPMCKKCAYKEDIFHISSVKSYYSFPDEYFFYFLKGFYSNKLV